MTASSPASGAVIRVGVVAAVFIVLAIALRSMVFAGDPELAGIQRDPPPHVAGLTFLDHTAGSPLEVDLVPPAGELRLVYFGYLSCPDVCPMTMSDIARARRDLDPGQAARTTVAFVTVDPERDDPDRLRGYLSHFFDDAGVPLTAPDQEALDDAAARLGVRYQIEPHAPGAERYGVDHSAITYVIDDSGTVLRELPYGVTPDEIAHVIRALLPT